MSHLPPVFQISKLATERIAERENFESECGRSVWKSTTVYDEIAKTAERKLLRSPMIVGFAQDQISRMIQRERDISIAELLAENTRAVYRHPATRLGDSYRGSSTRSAGAWSTF